MTTGLAAPSRQRELEARLDPLARPLDSPAAGLARRAVPRRARPRSADMGDRARRGGAAADLDPAPRMLGPVGALGAQPDQALAGGARRVERAPHPDAGLGAGAGAPMIAPVGERIEPAERDGAQGGQPQTAAGEAGQPRPGRPLLVWRRVGDQAERAPWRAAHSAHARPLAGPELAGPGRELAPGGPGARPLIPGGRIPRQDRGGAGRQRARGRGRPAVRPDGAEGGEPPLAGRRARRGQAARPRCGREGEAGEPPQRLDGEPSPAGARAGEAVPDPDDAPRPQAERGAASRAAGPRPFRCERIRRHRAQRLGPEGCALARDRRAGQRGGIGHRGGGRRGAGAEWQEGGHSLAGRI